MTSTPSPPSPLSSASPSSPDDDDDFLDGCDLPFDIDPDDDETSELRPLFPQGLDTPNLELVAALWRAVLGEFTDAP